jgi:hypothetical protein
MTFGVGCWIPRIPIYLSLVKQLEKMGKGITDDGEAGPAGPAPTSASSKGRGGAPSASSKGKQRAQAVKSKEAKSMKQNQSGKKEVMYKVKLIHAAGTIRGVPSFRIEWEGHPQEKNWTWEPEVNVNQQGRSCGRCVCVCVYLCVWCGVHVCSSRCAVHAAGCSMSIVYALCVVWCSMSIVSVSRL